MLKCHAITLAVSASLCGFGGCDSRAAGKKPALKAEEPPRAKMPPKLTAGSAVCKLNPVRPGPLRRGGKARVKLVGAGIDFDLTDLPALCGPLFNRDVSAIDVHAGDGTLFETCAPQGTLQISSWGRTVGQQVPHGPKQGAGTEVLFNLNKGTTYSSRGDVTDRIVFSDDLWHADATVSLYSVNGPGQLRAEVSFDCPAPGPWADDAAAKEAAKAP